MNPHRRTRSRRSAGGLIVATALVVSACGGVAADDSVTLSVNHGGSADHPLSLAFVEFADAVTERTGGEVEFEHTYEGAICAIPEGLDCVSNGTVDIGYMAALNSPELSLVNVSSLPFQATDIQAAADAHNQLQADDDAYSAELEGRGVRSLFYVPSTPPVVALKEPIDSFDDLSGLSLRAAGSMASAVEAFGGNAVSLGAGESYESIERGVVSGAVLPIESIVDLRLHEVAPYVYDIGEYVGLYVMSAFMINENTWESLSPEAQEAMTDAAAEVGSAIVDDHILPSLEGYCETAVDEGATISEIEQTAVVDQWVEGTRQELLDGWIADASSLDDPQASSRAYLDIYGQLEGAPTPPTHEICS
ncbi:TRAP transporter substrate-binding protein [Aeromicrobium sp. CF4.19]|uniref:TRAP transporter substrate-binding protein n=1 Tax=Aeromicrobium sp. CF4.19 TaxID=3373082 RepID=UPI003EE4C296